MTSFIRSFSFMLGLVLVSMVVAVCVHPVNANGPGEGTAIVCHNFTACRLLSNPTTLVVATCIVLPEVECPEAGCGCRTVVFNWNCECKWL